MKDSAQESLLIKEPKCWEFLLYNNKMQIFIVLILCAFIGIGTPFIWREIWKIKSDSCAIESDLRYNCYPQRPTLNQNKTKIECLLCPECCWDDFATGDQIKCYYRIIDKRTQKMPGYKIEKTNGNQSATLTVDKIPKYFDMDNNNTDNGPVIEKKLLLTLKHYDASHFSIKISTENSTDYSKQYLDYNLKEANNSVVSNASIYWPSKQKDDFTISVRRKQTNTLIFNTGDYSPFIFSKGFIEITTLLPNDMIFGLGQSPSKSFKHNMTYPEDWAIFNKQHLNLTANQSSWFGSHPFYLGLEGDGNAYGVLLINTHPIEVITNSRPSLTFRTIGGDLDFHFFMGPKPADVIKQLTSLIGRPSLPPYWALGFHLCRTTCDTSKAIEVLLEMRNREVPVESDCGDSALSSNLFSAKEKFIQLKEFYEKHVKNNGTKMTASIVPQKESKTQWSDVLMNRTTGQPYIGYFYDWCGVYEKLTGVKNESVIYPYYMSDLVEKNLTNELNNFEHIDGLILNYNTPLDLSYSQTGNQTCSQSLKDNQWDLYRYSEMNENTPCLDSVYTDINMTNHLSIHNLYGYQHTKMAKRALSQHKSMKSPERKLLVSLSTFTGSGQFGGHIGLFMNSSWDMLRQSLIQTLEFNMYGIPLTGFPVCGFTGSPKDEELCLRWYQLSAMQPFMISHRDFKQNLTDPISLAKGNNRTLEAIKSAITIRYRLLPYLYTQFYRANQFHETVMRPLFFEYPDDKKTYKLDRQYFWGSGLMISPVTELGVKSVKAYFPKGNWYDFYSGRRIASRNGGHLDLSAVEYHINLHIRGGHIIPTQASAINTVESRKNPYTLIAGLDTHHSAKGELFIDDGITENTIGNEAIPQSKKYLITKFSISSHNISIETDFNVDKSWINKIKTDNNTNTKINVIKIFGIIDRPFPPTISFKVENVTKPAFDESHIRFDQFLGVLTLKDLDLDLFSHSSYFLQWSYKQWN